MILLDIVIDQRGFIIILLLLLKTLLDSSMFTAGHMNGIIFTVTFMTLHQDMSTLRIHTC